MTDECEKIPQITQGERKELTVTLLNKKTGEAIDLSTATEIQSVHPTDSGYLYQKLERAAVAEVSTIEVVADVAKSLASKYFLIGSPSKDFAFYFVVDGEGFAPNLPGVQLIAVAINENDSISAVASKLQVFIDAQTEFDAVWGIPTSSVFDNTQYAKFLLPQALDTISISTWFKLDATDTTQVVFLSDIDAGYLNTLQIYYDGGFVGVQYQYDAYPAPSDVKSIIQTAHALDVWTHVVVTVNILTATMAFMLDGVLILEGPIQGDPLQFASGMDFAIGTSAYPTDPDYMLKGKVANFEVWNGILTEADALALKNAGYYQAPETIVNKPLLAHYLMGDNPADTITLIKDNKGTADATVSAPLVFDTVDLP